ncbi:response regulator receiver domain-containing protein [Mucilaginibacter gracilis]|uniref:Response regulator receiver domain-containing protein n=1 Tax=Mucilaginibacter gracilis TaxID=423350 RepID=A0A495J2W4_9SPHI|nr:response regulator [Mucilaginibacter gracilis]RKR83267.1 response regulator receiver domain-containing protein [Mucilaginibacter gracilis]
MLKKVLAVDDDPYILDALVELLKYSGYDVNTTPKGDEVFKKIDEFSPDIILLDIMLSGLDGREICRQIKSDKKTSQIPVIMISATPNLTQSVLESGANDFVAKPFDIFLLLDKIEKQILKAS